jgi:hypothetical protein
LLITAEVPSVQEILAPVAVCVTEHELPSIVIIPEGP